jgi:hypothetical protein
MYNVRVFYILRSGAAEYIVRAGNEITVEYRQYTQSVEGLSRAARHGFPHRAGFGNF